MGRFDTFSIKLKQCRNCFSIAQNDNYVAAIGDQIVIYCKENWTVQCVIPSKLFPHPYSLEFLSEHTFVVKNNYAQYMVYDVFKKDVLWKFKPRGYDSIDINLVVSPEGIIYDILTHRQHNSCCLQLVIFPETQKYEIRDLPETSITIEGWQGKDSGCSTIRLYKGNNQTMYLLKGYLTPQRSLEKYNVEYVLFQKTIAIHSPWICIKRWRFDKPIKFMVNHNNYTIVRNEVKRPIYFDEQFIVWNDCICEDWHTGECYCFNKQNDASTPTYIKRRYEPEHNIDIWLVRRGHAFQSYQYKTWEPSPLFCDIENSGNERICDVAVLNRNRKMLIGTMSGLYLCDLLPE